MPLKIITQKKLELINKLNNLNFDNEIYSEAVYWKLAAAAAAFKESPQLVIMLDKLLAAKGDFVAKYKDEGGLSFASEFMVKWIDLKDEVLKCGYSEEYIVLNFIYRYHQTHLRWYLTVECCEREHNSATNAPDMLVIDGITHYIYKIINRGHRFDIENGVVSTSTTLPAGADYDEEYFTKVKFNGAPLVYGAHVNSIMFPWKQELVKLHDENGLNEDPDVFIKFLSATMDCGAPDAPPLGFDYRDTLVQWPHGLMMHMNKAGTDYLNNFHEATIFKNHACNYGSMCPPRCNDYFWLDYLPKG